MSLETWIPFAIAALLIIIIPGPTILLVVSQSLVHGLKAAFPLVVGVFFGDLIAMLGSMLGLGVLMATSATLFSVVKLIGAVYLIYLGVSLWRAPVEENSLQKVGEKSPWQLSYQAFLVTVLNPKGIVFFLAFLPQFVNTETAIAPQLFILGATFLVLAVISAACYAILASRMGKIFTQPAARRWFNRGGGTALIGAGLLTATTQRV